MGNAKEFLGSNVSRYMDPSFDAMLDRYFATIPQAERTRVLGDIIAFISERLIAMGLFYDHEAGLVGNRLRNVGGAPNLDAVMTWNADRWEVN